MKPFLGLFFIFSLLFTQTSCQKKSESNTNSSSDESEHLYFSLALDNYWIYETSVWDSSGVFHHSEGWDTAYIAGDSIIAGDTFALLYDRTPKGVDTLYLYRQEHTELINQLGHRITGPGTVGDTLAHHFQQGLLNGYTVNIGEEAVTTPAGLFQCLTNEAVIAVYHPDGMLHYHAVIGASYARDIGLVKEVDFSADSAYRFEKLLIQYSVP